MFGSKAKKNGFEAAFGTLALIYHSAVRKVRDKHRNAFVSIGVTILQAFIMLAVFMVMFLVLGLRGTTIRGDFFLYILSGVFLYLTHIRVVNTIANSEGPTSPMMKHAPMNTGISVASTALSSLYVSVLAVILMLYFYNVLFARIYIYDPVGVFGMFLLAWFFGVAVGLIFLAMKPWAPTLTQTLVRIYTRANMITSGKMFVANSLPAWMLAIFDWNPLFHTIDQARGYMFINYFPHNSSWKYALIVSIVLLGIGMLLEFYTRKKASLSWSATQ
ncbi:ABC-2 type transporter [Pseudoruegeria aquimaris]|uniref:ABC-2 type transporter n=1 Tax=Pseudoruegeria aquimaris TaxID=393663 RepID=A0A1Y5RU19_9RHOB|nr:ABC transporter permease [Pseudoruegeria aquimaris]SLN25078.1 ABC-2 type transporter [Pseudoruegeria aquimaris]